MDAFLLKLAFWQIKGLINFSLIDFLKDIASVKKLDPYAKKRAKVRTSELLSPRERRFLKKRKVWVNKGLAKFLECSISQAEQPTIALCFSGGGYRAMIGTLAFLQQPDFLDTVTYLSSLSGSTWALSTWLGHNLEFNDLLTLTRTQISHSIINGIDRRLLIENGIWKLFYGQKMSLVGVWGSIVANVLFNDLEKNYIGSTQTRILRGQMPKLSQFRAKIDHGSRPMPLFTAVSVSNHRYQWLEFNPYEVGLIGQNKYIPSWSFGRHFTKGLSTDYAPEHGIDYLMGIWGSAFTASLGEILGHCSNKKMLAEVTDISESSPGFSVDTISAKLRSEFLKLRLSPAKIKSMEFEESPFLTLVDAGVDFNLPVPPLLKKERKLDLIIIADFSSNADTGSELKYAHEYALKNGLKFPKIDYEVMRDSVISVFTDPDPEVPVVIYMPMIKNDNYSKLFDPKEYVKSGGYCSTFNLCYTPRQFDELFGLIAHNLSASIPQIKEAMKFVIEKKKRMLAL